jgi:hypothetical protein
MHVTALPLEFFAAVVTALYIVKLVVEIFALREGGREERPVMTPQVMSVSMMEKRSLLNQTVTPRHAVV